MTFKSGKSLIGYEGLGGQMGKPMFAGFVYYTVYYTGLSVPSYFIMCCSLFTVSYILSPGVAPWHCHVQMVLHRLP